MGLTRDLAAFVIETPSRTVTKEVLQAAKPYVLDLFGNCLVASLEPVGKIAIKHSRAWNCKPEASVIASRTKISAQAAAFANSILARCLEFDDWLPMAHLSSKILPVSLAMAESLSLSGRKMLESYILALEVAAKIQLAIGYTLKTGGGGVISGIGTAAAAARCLRLTTEQTAIAFGITAGGGTGISQRGFMMHGYHQAVAAQEGIEAALLAKEGFTAADDIFERHGGIVDTVKGDYGIGYAKAIKSLGKPFRVVSPGMGVRKYPVVYFFQGVSDIVLGILEKNKIAYDDIKEVQSRVTPKQMEVYGAPKPKSGHDARFNLRYTLATAIYDRKVDVPAYRDEAITDPRRVEAMGKVKVSVLDKKDIPTNALEQTFDPTVKIILKNGRSFSHPGGPPRGDSTDTTPKQEIVLPKFKRLARRVLSEKKTQQVIDLVDNLDKLDSVDELMEVLRT